MKVSDLCPKCLRNVSFDFSIDYFDYKENEAIEGFICPHCKTKFVVFFNIEPVFYIRKPRENELNKLKFKKI